MKVKVTINRGQGKLETIIGKVVDETNSFFKVAYDNKENGKNEIGEWFPKQSTHINCVVIGE